LEEKSSGSGLENRNYDSKVIPRADYETPLYPQKLALTSSTKGGRWVRIDRARTTEFVFFFHWLTTEGSQPKEGFRHTTAYSRQSNEALGVLLDAHINFA
jgi:hypothetical protein